MKIFVTKEFDRQFKKLLKKKPEIKQKVEYKINLFEINPQHPNLRLHKLKGKQQEDWSISIEEDLRLIFQYYPEGILLVDIGKHDEVY